MTLDNLFKDGIKIDDSKKHLVLRPAYARIDKNNDLVCIWDYGPNYSSFSEMMSQRKEVSAEKMYAGLTSNLGLQFANRGLCLAKVLTYKGNRFLVTTSKRGSNTLGLLTGYFGNGINAPLEHENKVIKDIKVADQILRTAAIEELEEFNVVNNGKIQRGGVMITRGSVPVIFAPFKDNGLPYTSQIMYKVNPFDGRLACLANLHEFPVVKEDSAEDENPIFMGENIGIYFDRFHNCYQITVSLETAINDIDTLFQTEDKYRDESGMDTFLYRDGIKLVRLDDKGKMILEVYQIKENGKLESISIENLLVSDTLVPSDKKTGIVIAETLPFNQAVEMQN